MVHDRLAEWWIFFDFLLRRRIKIQDHPSFENMRFLIYSPDSYGLGHVRRSISIARAAISAAPNSSALLLTGAPRAHYFDYPERCDYVKLPSVTKDASGQYVCKDLGMSLRDTLSLRSRLIDESATHFRSGALLVDHAPAGLGGEILPTLRRLGRERGTYRILGMRDVIDEPEKVRATWKREDTLRILRECYDSILVYGQRDIFDVVREYEIPEDIEAKIRFVGYIPRNGRHADPEELRVLHAPRTNRLVVVTAGGGGDGILLLDNFIRGYAALGEDPPFEVTAVTGPLMSPRKRERFQQMASELPGLSLIDYCHELPDLFEAADYVVAMGGYNTVAELACARARALIVPRAFPRKEQLVRAQRLAARGVVDYMIPSEVTPERLLERVLKGLELPLPPVNWGLSFTGLEGAKNELCRLLGSAKPNMKFDKAEIA